MLILIASNPSPESHYCNSNDCAESLLAANPTDGNLRALTALFHCR